METAQNGRFPLPCGPQGNPFAAIIAAFLTDRLLVDGFLIPMTTQAAEVAKRRTFAIISHPDAGKTTITESCC